MASFVLQDNAYIEASSNSAYNFGTGPFTIEAWVHSTSCGPLVTRKPTDGGPGKTHTHINYNNPLALVSIVLVIRSYRAS